MGWESVGRLYIKSAGEKCSPLYNRVLRIYLFGTRIYNADINRPCGGKRPSIRLTDRIRVMKVKRRIRRERGQLIRTANFARERALLGEWKYIIVQFRPGLDPAEVESEAI